MSNSWSDGLISQTRAAIDDRFFAPDGFLHFKNANGNFGKISVANLLAGKWVIESKPGGSEAEFPTVDALIAAGWAID